MFDWTENRQKCRLFTLERVSVRKIYLVGAGGHCNACIDVIESTGEFTIAGIFDVAEKVGTTVCGIQVVGTDSDIKNYVKPENSFLITIGQIKSPELRKSLYARLKNLNADFATVVSPRAYVSRRASLGEGTIVMHDALVNANAHIGFNCIINTKALIEHDSVIEPHCHISTAAVVNGGCKVGEGTFVGSNSVLKEGAVVAPYSVLKAGEFHR